MIQKVDFAKAYSLLQTLPEVVLLDVREEPEYLTGHARNAELLPVDEITAENAAAIISRKDNPIMVYCRTGRRTCQAAKLLSDLGYSEIYDIGGLVGWPYGLE